MTEQKRFRAAFLLYLTYCVLSISILLSPTIQPAGFPAIILLPLFIPVFLFTNILFLLLMVLFRERYFMAVCIPLILAGLPYYKRTIGISLTKGSGELQVTSFNVRVFNNYADLKDDNYHSTKMMVKWLKENDSHILCLQEYFHNRDIKEFNITPVLRKSYPFSAINTFVKSGGDFGMAIFSKYKIANKGLIRFHETGNNQAMFADIETPHGTVRVYNMHLQSMHITKELLSTEKGKAAEALKRYSKSFMIRDHQVDILISHMKDCPYPVILAGDLNDVPYSHIYDELRKRMQNSFEEKGTGLGSTYHGDINHIRIDNIFHTRQLKTELFITHTEIPFSDHYPITAGFSFEANE